MIKVRFAKAIIASFLVIAGLMVAPTAHADACRTKHYSSAWWTYCDDGTSWHCTDDGRCYY